MKCFGTIIKRLFKDVPPTFAMQLKAERTFYLETELLTTKNCIRANRVYKQLQGTEWWGNIPFFNQAP